MGLRRWCVVAALALGAPAWAGPPFRTDDPEPVAFQHFEINLLSLGSETAAGWSGILPGLEVNYGALPKKLRRTDCAGSAVAR